MSNNICGVKRSILKKKILLNFIIEHYSKYDKTFRYVHMFVAVATPICIMISKIIESATGDTSTLTLILGTSVAAMIKLKDYLKFDKIKDLAKQQTIKYEQLFQRIERELMKPIDKQQLQDEFLYWVNREYNSIEISDPDIPKSIKDKYKNFCQNNHIPYDDDLDMLQELLSTVVEVVVDTNNDTVDTNNDTDDTLITNNIQNPQDIAQSTIENNTDEKENTVIDHTNEIQFIKQPAGTIIRQIRSRPRSNSDENAKREYRQKIQTLDTNKDLEWAMERLATLEDK